ncbi:hypothetical protein LA080_006186 [Diaporthe eres]|nr:hypothetical protein LA080_006186 [Diaporthe eres]
MDRDQTIENNQNVVVCVVCGDPAEEIPPCSHGYCWDCLTQLILHGCRDGERWPPRCCIWEVNMASPEIRENLPEDVLQLAALSKAYYSATGKLFCCNSKCRKYIPPGEHPFWEIMCNQSKSNMVVSVTQPRGGRCPPVSLILNPLAPQQWLDERAVVGVGGILRKASGPAHMHVNPLPNCRPV